MVAINGQNYVYFGIFKCECNIMFIGSVTFTANIAGTFADALYMKLS